MEKCYFFDVELKLLILNNKIRYNKKNIKMLMVLGFLKVYLKYVFLFG